VTQKETQIFRFRTIRSIFFLLRGVFERSLSLLGKLRSFWLFLGLLHLARTGEGY